MKPTRAFIAIELTPPVHQSLDTVIRLYRGYNLKAVRWVPVNNIHLTLRFLGDSSPFQLQQIQDHLARLVKNYPPFEMTLKGCGAFPNKNKPRVLWVGAHVPPSLILLQKEIETFCRKINFEPEERGFSPHLTLGRVSQSASLDEIEAISRAVQAVNVGIVANFSVHQITLFKSDLNPGGSVYTPLAHWPLFQSVE